MFQTTSVSLIDVNISGDVQNLTYEDLDVGMSHLDPLWVMQIIVGGSHRHKHLPLSLSLSLNFSIFNFVFF
jgi:hypothetical protein